MTDMTTTHATHRRDQGPHDVDTLLQGLHSRSSEQHAWTDADRDVAEHRYHDGTSETLVSEGPLPTIDNTLPDDASAFLPVPAADLEAASTRLRPDPASTKALKRLLDGGWTFYTDDETGTLLMTFDPRSKGRGKKPPRSYTTTHDSCTCPGAIIRGGCYHPLAWQIVNEALSPTTTIQCSLPSARFISLCLLALADDADDVNLSAESAHATLTLATPGVATGTVCVEMATSVLLTIEQQVRAHDLKRIVDALGKVLPPESDRILLDLSAESLLIIAGTEDAPMIVDGLDLLPLPERNTSSG